MISCKDISKSFGINEILKDVTFLIEAKEKAAIVGVNGAGKTTMFKIITGEQTYDSGEIAIQKGIKLGYLSQLVDTDKDNSIYEEVLESVQDTIDLELEIRDIEKSMSNLSGEKLTTTMNLYGRLTQTFEEKGGYAYKSRIRGVLKGLGFHEDEFDKAYTNLSGGQKTRVALAKLLMSNPDVILLDEPTNHLDINSVEWLESFLKNYNGTVVVISHDRYFLDRVCTKIIEIENKKSTVYNGNYSYYVNKKEIDREIQLKHYSNQQKEIKRQEEVIKTLRSFNREKSIKRAESREKLLDKIELVEKPDNAPETMRMALEPRQRSGNDVISVDSISKSFGDNKLFENASFQLIRGEKAALVGPNGIGKTTLLRIILGDTCNSGTIKIGQSTLVAYYDQEQQLLNPEKNILEEIYDAYPELKLSQIYNILAAFVFTGDDVYKKIGSLSGGERGRVALAKIMLSNANFLILDEPTNHLDIFSKEILENALKLYTGTILFISHDRYFINNVADKVLELSSNGITTYYGNYDYYIEKKDDVLIEENVEQTPTESKNTWQQKKEEQAKQRKKQTSIKKVEKEIEKIELQISHLEQQQALPEVYTDAKRSKEVYDQKFEAEQLLESLYKEWSELTE